MPRDSCTRTGWKNGGTCGASSFGSNTNLASVLDRIQHVRPQVETEWASSVAIRRDLVIHAFDADQRHAVTKLARWHTDMMLEQVRALLSNLPAVVLRDLPLESAEALRQEFTKVAIVTIERPAPKPA